MMAKPTLTINSITVEFTLGQTILEVARRAGIATIPTLCFLKGTTATGSCRICPVDSARLFQMYSGKGVKP